MEKSGSCDSLTDILNNLDDGPACSSHNDSTLQNTNCEFQKAGPTTLNSAENDDTVDDNKINANEESIRTLPDRMSDAKHVIQGVTVTDSTDYDDTVVEKILLRRASSVINYCSDEEVITQYLGISNSEVRIKHNRIKNYFLNLLI